MFQTAVLVFHTSQPLRFANLHPAVLTLPAIQRRLADAVLPGQLRHLPSRLVLLQNPYHLLLTETPSLHGHGPPSSLSPRREVPNSSWWSFSRAGQTLSGGHCPTEHPGRV